MTDHAEYSVSLSKEFKTNPQAIFNLFKNNTVFELTSADKIENDFTPGGAFHLTFNNRGVIFGHFIEISINRITAEWNVTGFEKPDETATSLEVDLNGTDSNCLLTLNHKNIKFKAAAEAKQRAWSEILYGLEMRLAD